jgi:hypothetical protein
MRPCPISTAATNGLVGLNGQTGERYLYVIGPSQAYRYDTWSDSWQEITIPQTATTTNLKGQLTKYMGHRGPVLAATNNTLQIGGCGYQTKAAIGTKIRIISGTGAGQERTITAVADPVIHDQGASTSGTTSAITDTVKKWRFNQWDGYTVRLLHASTPISTAQVRRILYNDQTVLTVTDANFQPIDSFNNTSFSSTSFNAPGTNTQYTIESVTLTVDTNWTVNPDASSIFMILSGGLWIMSTTSSQTLLPQYYDVLSDAWYTKTGIASSTHYASALTSYPFALIDEANGAFVTGATATSATAKSLVNSGASMTVDRYANHQVRIVSGTGVGQQRRIVGNSATTMHIERNWDINPDNTSGYEIWGDTDKAYVCGNGSASIYQYSVEGDIWAPGQIVDYGIFRNISAAPYATAAYGAPHQAFGITSIVRVTNGIASGVVNAAGTNYVVGDLVTCSTSGTLGTFFVTGVNSSGGVTSLQLAASGSGYANGSSATTGGSGSGLTITLTIGTTALVTTATNHDFKTGDQVTIAGCATDTSFNTLWTIAGVGSLTTFSLSAPSSTASPTAANSLSTTLIVDATKNWTTNEHTGKLVFAWGAGTSPTLLGARRITSNTATTITVTGAMTLPTNGISRYVICEPHALGAMQTYRTPAQQPTGWATSATSTTLVDSTKAWANNQWQACRVRIVCGTGLGNEAAITSNDATTLTVASWGVATPDATSKYEIMDSYGIVTTGTLNTPTNSASKLVVNQTVGKRLKIIAGTLVGTEAAITANAATTITAAVGTPDTTSYYAIYEPQVRSTGTERFDWLCGLSDSAKRGRYIISAISSTTVGTISFDLYDIPSNTWINNIFVSPGGGVGGSGTMYAYDNADSYFFTISTTGRISELKLTNMTVEAAGITPYVHSSALARSGMQVVTTEDGLKYIYIQRHTGFDFWRTLKFW